MKNIEIVEYESVWKHSPTKLGAHISILPLAHDSGDEEFYRTLSTILNLASKEYDLPPGQIVMDAVTEWLIQRKQMEQKETQ